jgi:SsrA-binding protein
MPPKGVQVVASNRRARHEYEILETYEAGIALRGSEVKSLRESKVQLADTYARAIGREVWLLGMHIAPYSHAFGGDGHQTERDRKLLLHRKEIDEIAERTQREHLTLVPLALYFKDGFAKVELALARGRKRHDKRQAIAARDMARDVERDAGRAAKGMV